MEAEPVSIKLLVIDIDGTLLDPEGKITPYTLSTLRAAQEAGIVVTLADEVVEQGRCAALSAGRLIPQGNCVTRIASATLLQSASFRCTCIVAGISDAAQQ